jgi:glycogen debranching enzyme
MDRHERVVELVRSKLLTPLGVRTLSPDDPAYHPRYAGDVISRDRAYHQGPAYPWLLGPLVSAYVRVHGRGDRATSIALEMLEPVIQYLRTDGLGQLPELFDAEPPFRPGGAVASARSVAEILRAYVEDVLDMTPSNSSSLIAGHRVPVSTVRETTVSP